MTSNERSNRRRFIEGAVCAGLQIPPRRLQFQWQYSWLYVGFLDGEGYNVLSYQTLHRLVTALDALELKTEGGQIVIYSDLTLTIRFFDPFDDIKNQYKQQ